MTRRIAFIALFTLFMVGGARATNMMLTGAGIGAGGGGGGSGKILLVDGASFILQTDGTSKICRAGGC